MRQIKETIAPGLVQDNKYNISFAAVNKTKTKLVTPILACKDLMNSFLYKQNINKEFPRVYGYKPEFSDNFQYADGSGQFVITSKAGIINTNAPLTNWNVHRRMKQEKNFGKYALYANRIPVIINSLLKHLGHTEKVKNEEMVNINMKKSFGKDTHVRGTLVTFPKIMIDNPYYYSFLVGTARDFCDKARNYKDIVKYMEDNYLKTGAIKESLYYFLKLPVEKKLKVLNSHSYVDKGWRSESLAKEAITTNGFEAALEKYKRKNDISFSEWFQKTKLKKKRQEIFAKKVKKKHKLVA